ncbi:MAG: hypothetical protein V4717_16420 [Bacteroidota bacterium]
MYKPLCLIVVLLSFFCSYAAFVPAAEKQTSNHQARLMTVSEFEAQTGKKLSWLERLQYKQLQRNIKNGKLNAVWNAEELTEGFQFLPFIGSILTLGILYLVMLFTAKDVNAIRWARWGAVIVLTAATVISLVGFSQGY